MVIPYRRVRCLSLAGRVFSQNLSEEVDLLQIACAPGANDQVQFEVEPFTNTERPFH